MLGEIPDWSALIPAPVVPSYSLDFWRTLPTLPPLPDYIRAQAPQASDQSEPDGETAESETDAEDDTDTSGESEDDTDQAPD